MDFENMNLRIVATKKLFCQSVYYLVLGIPPN